MTESQKIAVNKIWNLNTRMGLDRQYEWDDSREYLEVLKIRKDGQIVEVWEIGKRGKATRIS